MNKIKSNRIIVLVISVIFALVFFSEIPKKAFRSSKSLFQNYFPSYSQSSVDKIISKNISDFKEISMKAFMPHLNKSEIDLKLIRLPEQNIEIANQEFKISKFKANFLDLVKREPEQGPAYIDIVDNKLYIVQENGLFFVLEKSQLLSEEDILEANFIESNITNFVSYFDFFASGQFGIKDILIIENKMYVSYIREVKPDCFNASILQSNINKKLNFSVFYSPDNCIKRDSYDFNAHQSGGRLSAFKNNKILFSTGGFRTRLNAQKTDNPFGKILSIDLDSRQVKIISIGHRNPQGLYYSNKYQDIFSTEHGPNGGDELNHNTNPNSSEIVNFGWPIASYGGHYGASSYELENDQLKLKEFRDRKQYKDAPLHKNHAKFGFTEPSMNFSPSIGISQIIEVDDHFIEFEEKRALVFGSMGKAVTDFIPSLSLFFISIDNENNATTEKQIVLNERVRDLIYDTESNIIIYNGDLNGVIGIVQKIE